MEVTDLTGIEVVGLITRNPACVGDDEITGGEVNEEVITASNPVAVLPTF